MRWVLRVLAPSDSVPIAPLVCILWALYEKDIVDEYQTRTPEEYFHLIFRHENAAKKIQFFYYNVHDYKYDDVFNKEEKQQILLNSIEFFEEKFRPIRESKNYQKYQNYLETLETFETFEKEESDIDKRQKGTARKASEENQKVQKNNRKSIVDWYTYDSITIGLKENIRSYNEPAQTILDTLNNMKMNFYIEYEQGIKIYPLLVDILNDLFLVEYFFYHQKNQTRPLTSAKVWPEIMDEYEEGIKSYSYLFFSKLVRIQEIGSRNIRPYFLAEYARTLKVDKNELRLLMQNIFFARPEEHRGAFSKDFDIDPIKPAPFFLENTKMVIGGV